MRIAFRHCMSLVAVMACVAENEHPQASEVSRSEQAVAPFVQLWCGVTVGNVPVSISTPQECEDDRPGEQPKKIEYKILGDIQLGSDYEFDWRRPKKLNVQSGCGSADNFCDLTMTLDSGCGDTPFYMLVGFRNKRNPPGQWQWLTAVANTHLSRFPTRTCFIAALEPPTCSVVMGACDWTYRQAWLLAGQSSNSDATRHTTVEASFDSGTNWCTSYNFEPTETETWLVTVPTYTIFGRVRTETEWDTSPYCDFVLPAMTCNQQDN